MIEIEARLSERQVILSLSKGRKSDLERVIEQHGADDALYVALDLQCNEWLTVCPHTFGLSDDWFIITSPEGARFTESCEVYPDSWVAATDSRGDVVESLLSQGKAYMSVYLVKPAMTYRQLLEQLQAVPDSCLDADVTAFVSGEYIALRGGLTSEDSLGVLDSGHLYLVDKPIVEFPLQK